MKIEEKRDDNVIMEVFLAGDIMVVNKSIIKVVKLVLSDITKMLLWIKVETIGN